MERSRTRDVDCIRDLEVSVASLTASQTADKSKIKRLKEKIAQLEKDKELEKDKRHTLEAKQEPESLKSQKKDAPEQKNAVASKDKNL